MKLIKPSYEILTSIDEIEVYKEIEKVARTCYKSEGLIDDSGESAKTIVSKLITSGHEAMIEFFDITVKFICDRGVSHELVRHRIASFAQESTRYCNYSKDKFDNQITFIIPEWCKNIQEGEIKERPAIECLNDIKDDESRWLCAMAYAEHSYNLLIEKGWQAQQARSVLPNSTKTEINVKMNLREWRHFFKLRTALAAHHQMREITIPLLEELSTKLPIIFSDIKK